jgi:hypothetical protein
MSELCVETLWYGRQTDAIARQLNLFFKNFKALLTLSKSAEYSVTRKRVFFVSMPKNLAWTQQQGGLCVTLTS